MMVSMETYLLRGKRRIDQLAANPGARAAGKLVLYAGGSMLISGAPLWQQMQPFAAGLVSAANGIWAGAAALGGVVGYRLVWGRTGLQGVVWILGAFILGMAARWTVPRERKTELLSIGTAALIAISGLVFRLYFGESPPFGLFLLRVVVGAGSACLFAQLRESRNRMSVWSVWAIGVLALEGIGGVPWLNLGCVAAGALAAAAPITAAALAGAALEAAGLKYMTTAMCFGCLFRLAPVRDSWRRLTAPGLGCLTAMALNRFWDPGVWLGITLGGVIGAAIPWHWAALRRQGGVGAAQVQLEQTARIFYRMQRIMLDAPSPPVDENSILVQLRENACGDCSCRNTCREKDLLEPSILKESGSFVCRKNGRMLRELRRSQEQLRNLNGHRRRLAEYRSALVQQYGFVAGYLQLLADRLPVRNHAENARYHIQVSVRSLGKEYANGDRCVAFPGVGYRYYVLLCDGMGTGLGAAEEGRQASEMVRQMLTAGLPPQYAMGSVNSYLTLRGQAGAVTLDLAEIRLDTGRAAIYKWGAAPSLLFRRNRAEKIGTVTPPPGISITEIRETVVRLSLSRGEVLVLASDGIQVSDTSDLAEMAGDASPGELASHILQEYGGNGEDDATAAVIRLRPVNLAT